MTLEDVTLPINAVKLQLNNTRAFIGSAELGNGVLCVAERLTTEQDKKTKIFIFKFQFLFFIFKAIWFGDKKMAKACVLNILILRSMLYQET